MVETNLESVNIDVPNKFQEGINEVQMTAPEGGLAMSNLIPQTASLDQVSAKEYLQANVFPKLENALNTVSKNTNDYIRAQSVS